MFRATSLLRSSQKLLASKAIVSSFSNPHILQRSYWWKKNPKEDEKPEEPKKEEKKEEPPKEEKKELEMKKTVEKDENGFEITKIDFSKSGKNVTLGDVFKMILNEDEENENGEVIPMGNSFNKGNFDNFFKPNTRMKNEMILPAIPLPVRPLLPGFVQNLLISDRSTIQKLKEVASSSERFVGLFLRKEMSSNELSDSPDIIRNLDDIFSVGTCAEIRDFRMQGTNASIVLLGRNRIRLTECLNMGPPTMVKVKKYINPPLDLDEITMKAYANEVFSFSKKLGNDNSILAEYLTHFLANHEEGNPVYFADFAGGLTTENRKLQQRLLESESYTERLNTAIELFTQEMEITRVQKELQQQVQKNAKETERKFILREQMKAIQQQLGSDKDPKMAYIDKAKQKIEQMKKERVSEAAITAVEEELSRLSYTDIQSAEFGIIRNYIDWVTCLPWNKQGHDQMNIVQAEKVLNEDHYGLKDVKDRILEFIAVGKLQGHIPGKVLCFVGPPGTGKTSIAKSIARALGREYYQFSVGGANDVSQIKGHRRTYVGSMPGKLIHCLKSTKVNNPLILIDEVDKISASHQGDPASALLEVLDPNQNTQFVDNYLDVPVDFSKALFICTANDINTIPQPLLDRMEVIRISGYDYKEKLEISKNYLDKKARKATGLEIGKKTTPKSLVIADDAYESLIRWYCREAGVRNLEKYIEKIYRKVAMRLATMSPETIDQTDFTIHEKDLEQYIGKKIFLSDRLYDQTPAGVVMGLAWTSMGGATLYIECQTIKPHPLDTDISSIMNQSSIHDTTFDEATITSLTPTTIETITVDESKKEKLPSPVGHLTMTGQLGDVMKESIQIAYINARHWMQKLSYSSSLYNSLLSSYNSHKAVNSAIPEKDQIFNILETSDVHMHLPEGATPKDGPSAGCAITTSLLSTALHRPIKQGLAMTGEISLNGKVLPVGGIKEKVMAARRAGINEIILPAENVRDVNELPDYVKENLTIHYAKMYEDVLKYTELCPEVFSNK